MEKILNFFNFVLQYLTGIIGSIPFLLIIFTIITVILIIAIIVVSLSRKKTLPKLSEPPKLKKEIIKEDDLKLEEEKLPPILGWIGEFLSKKKVFQVNPLSMSFLKAIDVLEGNLGFYNAKYKLPWYALIGSEGSGKTTLLSSSKNHIPVYEFENPDSSEKCNWVFLKQAVMLDIKGDLFLSKNTNEKSWRSLLILLSRYRSSRPLNGIILTIDSTELYGKNKLTKEQIYENARFVASKLKMAQSSLGLRLPVYVVVTKIDTIPGFDSFSKEVPDNCKDDMLGWSSPFSLTTIFSPKWIEDAFDSIRSSLYSIRLELLAKNTSFDKHDGIFVFSKELPRLKEYLSTYLECVFKEDTYLEPLLFRGIYFCGKEGNINFFDSILSDKVFHEQGLAVPLKNKLALANKGLIAAKIFTAAFVLIGTYGAFHAFDRIIKSKERLIPSISKITKDLRNLGQISLDRPLGSGENFDNYSSHLVEVMNDFDKAQLFSVFIPASWYSKIHSNLEKTLRFSYQNIIVRTIYVNLLLKARHLLHFQPTEHTAELSSLLIPLESAEYKQFKQYVLDFEELQKNIEKFNHLITHSDPSELSTLINYTFSSQLPDIFWKQYRRLKSLLKNTTFPRIDLAPYKHLSEETLKNLFKNFLNAIFNVNYNGSLCQRLHDALTKIQELKTNEHSVSYLRELSNQLSKAKPKFRDKPWLDSKYFEPGIDFNKTLIQVEYIFGKSLTQFLVDQAAIGFFNLKSQLQVFNKTITEQSPDFSLTKTDPSYGILMLEKGLYELFLEPYMFAYKEQPMIKEIPDGKMIIWDTKILDVACDLISRYDSYLSKIVIGFPSGIQSGIRRIAQKSLKMSLFAYVSRAQSIVDIPTNTLDGTVAEEILRSKISDVKESSSRFLKLLNTLNQDNDGTGFVELRDMLHKNGIWLLEKVEKMFESFCPYQMQDESLTSWNGRTSASLAAYGVKDFFDLKAYLSAQREYMMQILEFAKPLIAFLNSDHMKTSKKNDLLLKWERIVSELESYKLKKPGNSVVKLENFILNDLSRLSIDTIFDAIPYQSIDEDTGDYFIQTLSKIKKAFLAKAEVLKRKNAINSYKKLAAFFNDNLKGKFPFVGSNLMQTTMEASPEQMWEFFNMFRQMGGSAKKILDQLYQLNIDMMPVVVFLKQMEEVKDLFDSYFNGSPSEDIPTIEFFVDFRVNRKNEQGGNMIADWTLKPNEDVVINKNDKKRFAKWQYNQPMEIAFRWPDSISINLERDQNQPSLDIDEKTASFKYTSKWAMLWMLRLQSAKKGDYVKTDTPNPYITKFVIPNDKKLTIVYNQISIVKPSNNPKSVGTIIPVPTFPMSAPSIPDSILQLEDHPVLTNREIEPLPWKEGRPDTPYDFEVSDLYGVKLINPTVDKL